MSSSYALVIELTYAATLALMTLAAAWLSFLGGAQTKPEQVRVQEWFRATWERLAASPWLNLPEEVVLWLARATKVVVDSAHRLIRHAESSRRLDLATVWTMVGGLFFAGIVVAAVVADPGRLLFLGAGFVAFLLLAIFQGKGFATPVALVCLLVPAFLIAFAQLLNTEVWFALLSVCVLGPWLAGGIATLFRAQPPTSNGAILVADRGIAVGLALVASCVVTLAALALGALVEPQAPLPRSLQMLAANVACDTLSIGATAYLLALAVGPSKRLFLLTAVLLDLAIVTGLAIASLWAALLFTPQALSVRDLLRVLIGRSPTTDQLELGPFFFLMHTTFLPVLTVCAFILMSWLAKAFFLRLHRFLWRAQHPDINGLTLTGRFVAFMAALVAVLGVAVGIARRLFFA